MIIVLLCLPSEALSQHLPSYLGFSYLGRGLSLHGCSSKAQPLLLTLDKVYRLMAASPDLELGVARLSTVKCMSSSTQIEIFFPCSVERAETGASTVHTDRAQLARSSFAFQVNKAPGRMRRRGEGQHKQILFQLLN